MPAITPIFLKNRMKEMKKDWNDSLKFHKNSLYQKRSFSFLNNVD